MPPKQDSVQSSRPSPGKWQGSKLGPDELHAGLVPGCHSSGGRDVLPGLVGDNWAGLGAYQLSPRFLEETRRLRDLGAQEETDLFTCKEDVCEVGVGPPAV